MTKEEVWLQVSQIVAAYPERDALAMVVVNLSQKMALIMVEEYYVWRKLELYLLSNRRNSK